jgi:hypothetical protein
MENLSRFEELRRDQEALRYQFISTELDLALTFAGISRSTDDKERYERNLDHARKAIEAAKKYLGETNLKAGEREEIVEKLRRIEPLIASLRSSQAK